MNKHFLDLKSCRYRSDRYQNRNNRNGKSKIDADRERVQWIDKNRKIVRQERFVFSVDFMYTVHYTARIWFLERFERTRNWIQTVYSADVTLYAKNDRYIQRKAERSIKKKKVKTNKL